MKDSGIKGQTKSYFLQVKDFPYFTIDSAFIEPESWWVDDFSTGLLIFCLLCWRHITPNAGCIPDIRSYV